MRQPITLSVFSILLVALLGGLRPLATQAQAPVVTSRLPARHAVAAPRPGPVSVTFSQAIAAASARRLRVYGSQVRGRRPGTLSGGGSATLSLAPDQAFAPGERVSVSVPATLTNAAGTGASRQVYEFWAATGGAGKGFFLDTLESVPAASRDQLLGDLDNDGDLDLLTNSALAGMFSYLNDGQGHFTPRIGTVVANTVGGATLADLNQDGTLDLLTGDADNATVAVALGDSTGGFGLLGFATQLVPVGSRPMSVAAGDVDGDGDLDFVAANYGSGTVTIGFNGGPAVPFRFTGTSTVGVGLQPNTVRLADVDNDGDLDLLTSNGGAASVSVRLNNGSGVFSGSTSVAVGTAPSDLVLADLDGDGDLDLLTANAADGTVSVRLNNGSGTFAGSTTLALPGSSPTGLQAGDVDADGDQDVVVASGAGGQLVTLLNGGAGTLAVQYGALELRTPPGYGLAATLGVALGDVDGDGDLDAVTLDSQRLRVVIGRNGLAPPVAAPTLTAVSPGAGPVGTVGVRLAGTNLGSTTSVTFNGVSASFVVTSNQLVTATVPAGATTGPVTVATAGGQATAPQPFTVTAGPVAPVLVAATVPGPNALAAGPAATVQATFASSITSLSASALRVFGSQRRGAQAGPVSGGGSATLSLTPGPAFAPGERVQLCLPATLVGTTGGAVKPRVVEFRAAAGGTGQGFYDATGSTSTSAPVGPGYIYGLRPADFDNDGDLDLVSAGGPGGTVELRLNNGSGTFGPAVGAALPTLVGAATEAAVADVDSDGDLDLLVAEGTTSTQPAARLNVWLNNGQGRFTAAPPLLLPSGAGTLLRVGDLDADADLDVVLYQSYPGAVRVAFNNGTGTFTLGPAVSNVDVTFQQLADLDADGDLDLLVAGSPGGVNQLQALLNNGQGGLTTQTPQPVIINPVLKDLAVGDLTGDGLPDAVLLGQDYSTQATTSGTMAVWVGLGNGQFGLRAQPLALLHYPQAVVLADANADGRLDALTLSYGQATSELATCLGDGHGGLRAPDAQSISPTPDAVGALEAADFDGDGDLDAAYLNTTRGQLNVRFNQGRPAPTLSAFSPTAGPAGTLVLLTGTNLGSARQVTFGGVATTDVRALSATQCAAVVPAGAVSGPVTVSTPAGTATGPGSFTVLPAPVAVVSRSPARLATTGPSAGPVQLTLAQSLSAAGAGNLVVRTELRQGRRAGAAGGAGTAGRSFSPSLPFAAGERVQVTLPVLGGAAAGTARPEVYDFVAAATGPGRGNLQYSGAGLYPGGVLADFDEDGYPDLLSLTEGLNTPQVWLLFNDARGGLGTTRKTALPYANVKAALAADLNGDSHLDLLLSDYGPAQGASTPVRLLWRAGAGDGTFGSPQVLHYTSSAARSLAVGDLNADGLPDITAVVAADSTLVSLNQGGGVFRRRPGPTAAPVAYDQRLLDCNNDGFLDLLSIGAATQLYYSLGTGTGDFVPQTPVPLGDQATALTVGDVNADNLPDLLVGTITPGLPAVKVLLGTASGGFSLGQVFSIGGQVTYLGLADMDSDGDPDLLATVPGYNGLQVLLNNGAGQFNAAAPLTAAAGRIAVQRPVVADLDLDGSLDLVLGGDSLSGSTRKRGFFTYLNRPLLPVISSFTPTSGGAGTVVTVSGTGLGGLTSVTVGGVPVAFAAVSATQFTLTIAANTASGRIVATSPNGIATSAGSFTVPAPVIGSFTPASGGTQRLVTLTGSYFGGVTAVRFNGVPAPGFAVLGGTQLTVLVPAGASTGLLSVTTPSGTASSSVAFTFAPAASGFVPGRNAQHVAPAANLSLSFSQPVSAAAGARLRVSGSLRGRRMGTLTGTGTGQLTFDPTLDFIPNELLSVSIPTDVLGMQGPVSPKQVYQFRAAAGGTGRGTFSPLASSQTSNFNAPVHLGDMDGDGDLDQVATWGYDKLAVAFNDGAGGFGTPVLYPIVQSQPALALADFDGDGDLDVAVGHDYTQLSIWRNDGAGSLTRIQVLALLSVVSVANVPLEVGDLDGDGDLDLLALEYIAGNLQPLLNDGSGTFSPGPVPAAGTGFGVPRLADVDADGDLDVVYIDGDSSSPNPPRLGVRYNDGSAYFSGTYSVALPYTPNYLRLGDVDGDGLLDAVVVDEQQDPNIGPHLWGLTVLRGDAAGHFALMPGRRSLSQRGATIREVALGDVDADGDLDLVASGTDFNQNAQQVLRPFLNNGAGNFLPVTELPVSIPSGNLVLNDLDGDGDLDLLAPYNPGARVFLNGPTVPTPLAGQAPAPWAARASLHPNPVHQQVLLALPAGLPQAGTLELLNTLGQLAYRQALPAAPAGSQVPVVVAGLAPGLYLVRLAVGTEAPQPLGRLVLE